MRHNRRNPNSRRCLSCKVSFTPDPRSRHRQLFCSDPACKKASKALSQKYWHAKPENRNYWRGPEHVERVRAWRKAHPKYWKRWVRKKRVALQDDMAANGRPMINGASTFSNAVGHGSSNGQMTTMEQAILT